MGNRYTARMGSLFLQTRLSGHRAGICNMGNRRPIAEMVIEHVLKAKLT